MILLTKFFPVQPLKEITNALSGKLSFKCPTRAFKTVWVTNVDQKHASERLTVNHNTDTGLGLWQSLLQSVTDKHIIYVDIYN